MAETTARRARPRAAGFMAKQFLRPKVLSATPGLASRLVTPLFSDRRFQNSQPKSQRRHALWWMGAAFVVAFALGAIALAIYGAGNTGTVLALRITARWAFLLFWLAYVGSAMAKLYGPRFAALAGHGRELGLAFAPALLIHVGLVLWLIYIATGPGGMMLFWIGIICTYLLALFSLPQLRDALGPRLWRTSRTIALEYIALAFAADFILAPLQAGGPRKYPVSYLPFAIMLIIGAGLRLAAFVRRNLRSRFEQPKYPQLG
jgi:hypothetical protein